MVLGEKHGTNYLPCTVYEIPVGITFFCKNGGAADI